MSAVTSFDDLIDEGLRAPVQGWDFSWFAGRASEERAPWGYSRLLADRMSGARVVLDLETGGGEVLAGVGATPPLLVATESWRPNAVVAAANLRRVGGWVVETAEAAALPLRDGCVDLVTSRHPVHTRWDEVARVLRPGGIFLSQQIGEGTLRELTEAVTGRPAPPSPRQRPAVAAAAAQAAGLTVLDLREAALRTVFHDIGAVVCFLRKVVWTVPDFHVERYRPQLLRLHERIQHQGPFVAHARRFLIEARRPD